MSARSIPAVGKEKKMGVTGALLPFIPLSPPPSLPSLSPFFPPPSLLSLLPPSLSPSFMSLTLDLIILFSLSSSLSFP